MNDPLRHPHPRVTAPSLLVVANRGPVTLGARGEVLARTAGGLSTLLSCAAHARSFLWMAVAGSAGERAVSAQPQLSFDVDDVAIPTRYMPLSDAVYQLYYAAIGNQILWPFHHYLLDLNTHDHFTAADERAWTDGYVAANRHVGRAVLAQIRHQQREARLESSVSPERHDRSSGVAPVVLLQDFHLYLVAGILRHSLPALPIAHFVHVPWPGPDFWALLPRRWNQAIYASLTCADVVGVQTTSDVRNILACFERFRPELEIVPAGTAAYVRTQEHTTLVRSYPASIDGHRIQQLASTAAAPGTESALADPSGRKTILRVDRLDPSKNIIRGLLAFQLLLECNPELVREVRFLLLLMPPREGAESQQRYAQEVRRLAANINAAYQRDGLAPITLVEGNDWLRALGAMRRYDVMLVNSVAEGMSLVAKEGAVVNENDGVLVVSRTAGVFQELGDEACIGITPTDIAETAQALHHALVMPRPRREALASEARARVSAWSAADWLQDQLADLTDLTQNRVAER